MKVLKLKDILLSLGASVLASALGILLGGKQGEVYRSLRLPAYAPPGIVFLIVWSVLYLLLALAAYWVLTARIRGRSVEGGRKRAALSLHYINLALTAVWPLLFFRLKLFSAAFVLITVMIAAGLAAAICFYRIRPAAGWLYVPYLVWISFALALTGAVVRLN